MVFAANQTGVILHQGSAAMMQHQCTTGVTLQVAGSEGKTTVAVTGVCDQPRVSTEPALVFARRLKTRPDSAKISRQFILSTGQFEFGPLLAGRDSQGYRYITCSCVQITARSYPSCVQLSLCQAHYSAGTLGSMGHSGITRLIDMLIISAVLHDAAACLSFDVRSGSAGMGNFLSIVLNCTWSIMANLTAMWSGN